MVGDLSYEEDLLRRERIPGVGKRTALLLDPKPDQGRAGAQALSSAAGSHRKAMYRRSSSAAIRLPNDPKCSSWPIHTPALTRSVARL
jgi:hypothetical protein